jgi:hypothetical protein
MRASYDLQIWSLSFAHGLTRLSDLPCMGPSMQAHIREPGALVTCKLNFCIIISLFENTQYEMKCLPGLFLQCN